MGESQGPDVAVVIPYYNDSGTIRRALRSVAEQTLRPRAVYVVDDASRPSEAEALAVIAQEFENLALEVITCRTNGGPSAARNVGWDRVTARYIAFLDADDSWLPLKLELQSGFLEQNPGVRLLGTARTYAGSNPAKHGRSERIRGTATQVSSTDQLLRNRFATSSVMLRTEVPLRFDVAFRYSEDNDLWCRMLLSGIGGYVLSEPLVRYYNSLHSGKGASGHYLRMLHGQLKVYHALRCESRISVGLFSLAIASSVARFVRRLLLAFCGVACSRLIRRFGFDGGLGSWPVGRIDEAAS